MRILTFAALTLVIAGCGNQADTPPVEESEDTLPTAAAVPSDLSALSSPYVDTPLSNEIVDVHRVTLPAGESLSPHEGGARVIYSLSAYEVSLDTDGMSETNSFSDGDIHAHGAGVHSIENVGSGEASFVVFERMDAPLPEARAEGETSIPSPAEGAMEEKLFGGDIAEVHRITLEPGARLAEHRGYPRAIYSLSDYTLAFTGDAGTVERTFTSGDAHYHDPGEHTVENVGEAAAEFLVVEFLR